MSIPNLAPFGEEFEAAIAADIGTFKNSPLSYVLYAFPWGKEGTPLAEFKGPDVWQERLLVTIGECSLRTEQKKAGKPLSPLTYPIEGHPDDIIYRQFCVATGHGVGKAQPLSTLIPTPSGVKKLGSLVVGDFVFDKNGCPTRIRAVFPQGKKKAFRVTFDDSSSTICCDEHLWLTRGRQERRKGGEWVTLSLREMVGRGIKRKNGVVQTSQFEVPAQGPASFTATPVPLSPYLLGVWLGDGSAGKGSYSGIDTEIDEHIRATGHPVKVSADGITKGVKGLKALLRTLGILGNRSYEKSIPLSYLQNDSNTRAEILRGLLDTDGTASKEGRIIFTSTSSKLLDDVIWLARSLGGKARRQEAIKYPWYTDSEGKRIDGRPAYNATITMPDGFLSFYVSRKQARISSTHQSRYRNRWITSVEEVEAEEMMCIEVEAISSTYLTNDFIVTHNTAFFAWLDLWFMSTRPGCRVVTTANTKKQLEDKTWAELAKWQQLSINGHWFEHTATKFYKRGRNEKGEELGKSWFSAAVPWTEENSESFAGTHETAGVLLKFDEASNIASQIWEVAKGALTTPDSYHVAFGNPTRNDTTFAECFSEQSHRWYHFNIDARDSMMSDKDYLQEIVDDYGEDHDITKVRVLGQFPSVSSTQLIPTEAVKKCFALTLPAKDFEHLPVELGVDVARFGDDLSVIAIRQGRKYHPFVSFRKLDTMSFADQIAIIARQWSVTRIFIDSIGIGGPVVDRLRQLGWGAIVVPVHVGEAPNNKKVYFNKRMECYDLLKDRIIEGIDLPESEDLLRELTYVEYGYNKKNDKLQLESKDSLKKKLKGNSPDFADSIAIMEGALVMEVSDVGAHYSESVSFFGKKGSKGRSDVTGY